MAAIDLSSAASGGGGGGNLQLASGASMDTTLRAVTDTSNTASTLKLSTTSAQFVSPLRISTDDPSDFYLDCEDGSTNNRFSITRNTSSQQVNLNFSSNPGGGSAIVGAIRTYVDDVNLSEVVQFREDGRIQIGSTAASAMYWDNTNNRLGVGTNAPTNKLSINGTNGTGITLEDTGANKGSFVFQSGGTFLQGFNNGLFLGTIAAPNSIKIDYQGFVGIGTTSPSARTHIVGSGSTSATTSLLVQNSSSTTTFSVNDAGELSLGSTAPKITLGGDLTITSTVSPTRQMVYDVANSNLSVYSGGVGEGFFIGNRLTTSRTSTTFVTPDALNAQGAASITAYDSNGNIAINASNNGNRSIALKGLGADGAVLIGNITTGNGSVYSAILRADSTTQGFLPPRMTNAQRGLIATPSIGLMVYCTDAVEGLYVYKSTGWTFVI